MPMAKVFRLALAFLLVLSAAERPEEDLIEEAPPSTDASGAAPSPTTAADEGPEAAATDESPTEAEHANVPEDVQIAQSNYFPAELKDIAEQVEKEETFTKKRASKQGPHNKDEISEYESVNTKDGNKEAKEKEFKDVDGNALKVSEAYDPVRKLMREQEKLINNLNPDGEKAKGRIADFSEKGSETVRANTAYGESLDRYVTGQQLMSEGAAALVRQEYRSHKKLADDLRDTIKKGSWEKISGDERREFHAANEAFQDKKEGLHLDQLFNGEDDQKRAVRAARKAEANNAEGQAFHQLGGLYSGEDDKVRAARADDKVHAARAERRAENAAIDAEDKEFGLRQLYGEGSAEASSNDTADARREVHDHTPSAPGRLAAHAGAGGAKNGPGHRFDDAIKRRDAGSPHKVLQASPPSDGSAASVDDPSFSSASSGHFGAPSMDSVGDHFDQRYSYPSLETDKD